MTAHINQAVVEGLATMGLGHKVGFKWESWPLNATYAANCVEEASLRLPGLPDESSEELLAATVGLALLGVQAHGATEWRHWPEGGLQREALACLELASACGGLLRKMPFIQVKLLALRDLLVDLFEPEAAESDRLLQCLMLASLEISLEQKPSDLWSGQSAGVKAVHSFLDKRLATCTSTLERADLVRQLVPPEVPSAMPKEAAETKHAGQDQNVETQVGQGAISGASQSGDSTCHEAADGAGKEGEQPLSSDGTGGESQPPGGEAISAEGQASGRDIEGGKADDGAASADEERAEDEPVGGGDDAAESFKGAGSDAETEGGVEGLECAAEPALESHDSLDGLRQKSVEFCDPKDDADDDTAEEVEDAIVVELGSGGSHFAGDSIGSKSETFGANCGRVLASLLRVFQDKRKRKVGLAHSGNRVASHRFWRLKRLGDTKVFKSGAERTGQDMAVEILLDRSESMKLVASRMKTAKEVTMMLAHSFTRMMGVKVAVDLFPGVGETTQSILAFGGNLGRAQAVMDSVYADGGTPLGDAIATLRPGLLAQNVERRIVLVITDGQPEKRAYAQQQLDECRQQGIEVFAIGIGVDVTALIEQSISVATSAELAEAVVLLFASIMDQASA